MDSHDIETYFRQHRRMLAVIFVMICMLSVSGLFMGMLQTKRHAAQRMDSFQHEDADYAAAEARAAELPEAPDYRKISVADWLANQTWSSTLDDLPRADIRLEAGPLADEAERQAAVDRRAARRAYDGAPPVIPHGIDAISSASCMSCHGQGGNLVIGGLRPAEISHPWVTNCTSCHVPENGLRQITAPAEERLAIENYFVGKRSAGPGPRAYDAAPPVTPHPVWMRQNCMACHGPGREHAIRTSHPERGSCLQCHAPDAVFDNREFYLTNPRPPLESMPPPSQ